MSLQIEKPSWTPTSRQRSEGPAVPLISGYQLRRCLLSPLLLKSTGSRPKRRPGERSRERGGVGSWCCSFGDWRRAVGTLGSPGYTSRPPLTTLGKRWFWVFFLYFLSQLQTPGLSGEGIRRHQRNLQRFLTSSPEGL